MCLLTFSWNQHPKYKLIMVANRDEYFNRPTKGLHQWDNGIYAGKDLKGGGTWMGFHTNGKFAALTNYRDPQNDKPLSKTRGELVTNFLNGSQSPKDYLRQIEKSQQNYNGFNLLVAEKEELMVFSNYGGGIQEVIPGIHGLSNAFLNTPWPKVEAAKADLKNLLEQKTPSLEDLIKLLQSKEKAPVELLPNTGIPIELEQTISSQFIRVDDYYGTVNTTALCWGYDGNVSIKEVRTIPEREINESTFVSR
ncbi:NRDE family protein [Cyclobacterium sediminis]